MAFIKSRWFSDIRLVLYCNYQNKFGKAEVAYVLDCSENVFDLIENIWNCKTPTIEEAKS